MSVLAQTAITAYKNHKRVLLVFAPTATDLGFTQQQQMLKNRASERSDRDLIFISVLNQGTTTEGNPADAIFLSATEQKQLRNRYNIEPREFAVLLLGKDGGEKLRSRTPVTMEELSHLIDSMPMRQQELRQRTRSKETRE